MPALLCHKDTAQCTQDSLWNKRAGVSCPRYRVENFTSNGKYQKQADRTGGTKAAVEMEDFKDIFLPISRTFTWTSSVMKRIKEAAEQSIVGSRRRNYSMNNEGYPFAG